MQEQQRLRAGDRDAALVIMQEYKASLKRPSPSRQVHRAEGCRVSSALTLVPWQVPLSRHERYQLKTSGQWSWSG
jgi:hypothetical protein